MKLDKVIKKKFVYSKNKNLIKSLYFLIHKYFKNKPKKSYSFGGVDLLVNHFFKNQKKGIYIDIGCYHPIQGSNTYLLFKKGWNGINIDLDQGSIDLFNHFRKNDYNKKIAISDKKGQLTLYSHHDRSAVQSVSIENSKRMSQEGLEAYQIECDMLNSVIEESQFKNKKIDFLSIDIEGHELTALKNFDFEKYDPSLVVIEYNDPELISLEFYYQKIENLINSEIYKFMIAKQYKFVNWHHADLIFASNTIFKKRQVY